MKIAVVAPCAVPYVVGGQEKLCWGLVSHFNEETAHQCELIKMPSPEGDIVSLIRSYQAFSALNLSGFDLVISGKYPAWMVAHENHVCYMLHRLRGMYDSYPGVQEVPGTVAAHPQVGALRAFMKRYSGMRSALDEFFGRWNELAGIGNCPAGTFDFPGPFAREIVHWLDNVGLNRQAIRHFAAISKTVAARPGYFPSGADVAVAYPPAHRLPVTSGLGRYFFTASRLDAPKRIALIIESMRFVSGDVPLWIAGTGPEESRLKTLAKADSRIKFLGYVGDKELGGLYREALAVPFVPYQEDYGLITVEAMQAGKPVVTTADSGGPAELVVDGESGFVCDPTPEAIGARLQLFVDTPSMSLSMGSCCQELAASISWKKVERTLIREPVSVTLPSLSQTRPLKLVLACTFPIYPPRHGGQSRIFHFFRGLAPEFETVIVSTCNTNEPAFEGTIAPGLREIRIPVSARHANREAEVAARMGTPVTDVVMPELYSLTPEIRRTLAREAQGAHALIASHPYLFPAIQGLGVPIWYEAQDLEFELKQDLFKDKPGGKELLARVFAVENAVVQEAEVIFCTSNSDADGLVRLFGAAPGKFVSAPNGTDTTRIPFTGQERRHEMKKRIGLDSMPLVLFMGSGHWPNIEAVRRIFSFAVASPTICFLIMGSVCYAFNPDMMPQNVLFLGEVDDTTRNLCLEVCDIALNPMEFGTGTNLKMLDFFSAGIPVISTECGARGLMLTDEEQCLVREIRDFPAMIEDVLTDNESAARRSRAARDHAMQVFDWDKIAAQAKSRLMALRLS